ncbi:MAG: hypothetical protein HY649_02665 [Acidobacteria bacterium]|nr:hypothetical protein [Acidobacteriota bacterium]
MKSEKTKAVLYVVLIFLCGFLSGAVATNLWTYRDGLSSRARADSPRASGTRSRERALERFQQRLDLSPEQMTQLHAILDETRQSYRQHELEIKSIRDQGNARIRAILNDEQKARFDQMIAEVEKKRLRRDKSN